MPTPPQRLLNCFGWVFERLRRWVYFASATAEGCICPVCGANNVVKRYPLTPVHHEILRTLRDAGVPMHCKEFSPDGQGYNKMLNVPKHYRFIRQDSRDPDKPFDRSGRWRITPRGIAYINNEIAVPIHCWVIHDTVQWWSPVLDRAEGIESHGRRQRPKTLYEEIQNSDPSDETRGRFRTDPAGY